MKRVCDCGNGAILEFHIKLEPTVGAKEPRIQTREKDYEDLKREMGTMLLG